MEIKKEWILKTIEAAKSASKAIMEIYALNFEVDYKSDQSPVTAADRASSEVITTILAPIGIPVISEEERIPPYADRKEEPLLWMVDPLDGTKEFIRKNDEFCICIALIHKNQSVFGLIASPTAETILLGNKELGVYYFNFSETAPFDPKNKIAPITLNSPLTIAHSRSHFSKRTAEIIDHLTNEHGKPSFIKKGSALKFIDLALNKADFYPRMAPTMEWDIAAGQAIYEALGGEVLDFTNFEPLRYNKEDLHNPFFIAKNKNLKLT